MDTDNGKSPKVEFSKAPAIQFGEQFEAWDDKRKIAYLKELASSSNHALDLMQKERDALLVENARLKAQVANADTQVGQQKDIMLHALTKQNEDAQQAAVENQRLQKRLRVYEQIVKLVKDND